MPKTQVSSVCSALDLKTKLTCEENIPSVGRWKKGSGMGLMNLYGYILSAGYKCWRARRRRGQAGKTKTNPIISEDCSHYDNRCRMGDKHKESTNTTN